MKAKNIFPPYPYQEFVCSKIAYYRHLKKNGIGILPTVTMTTAEYKKLGHREAMKQILGQVQSEGWDKFIAKPEHGQDGRDQKFFGPRRSKKMDNHVRFCMKKYPGIVFQKAIEGFGKTKESAECRLFYCGDTYHYSMVKTTGYCLCPDDKDDRKQLKKLPLGLLKRASREVVKKLPRIVMPNGTKLPLLISRVDMGSMVDGKVQPFVNEIEYCPAYFAEVAPMKAVTKYIKSIGRQMVKITKMYMKQSASRKKTPRHRLKRKRG